MRKKVLIGFFVIILIQVIIGCGRAYQVLSYSPSISITMTPTMTINEVVKHRYYNLTPDEVMGFGDIFDFSVTKEDSKVVQLADAILDGNLYSNGRYSENPKYSIENIDWDIQFSKSPTSYNLGLQTLDIIGVLSNAYVQTREIKYLDRAYKILKSWIAYANGNPKSVYVWYDHAIASRVINIIYFLSIKNLDTSSAAFFEEVEEKELIELLHQHADYLMDPSHYGYVNNHGIMSDRALIILAIFLPEDQDSETWLETGITRLRTQFDQMFQPDGSYAENSPGYANAVVNWFIEIEVFLDQHGYEFDPDFENKLPKMKQFIRDLVMPNGSFPMFGDTMANTRTMQALEPSNEQLSIYPDGGYVFINDHEENLWLGFKAGYLGWSAHKHEDDLSFVLYGKDLDIFLDSGMYNYESSSPLRRYFVSALAHNTVIVDHQSFSTSLINDHWVGLKDWGDTGEYRWVTGFNELYPSTSIVRSVYYIKPGVVLIFDDVQSTEKHTYSQLFHLNEKITANPIRKNLVELSWDNGAKKINMWQLWGDPKLKIHRGNKDVNGYGIISRTINQVIETTTLEYSLQGQNICYVTLIDLTNTVTARVYEDGPNHIGVEIAIISGPTITVLSLDKSTREITLKDDNYSEVFLGNVDVTVHKQRVDKNTFIYSLELDPALKDQYLYTWYIRKDGSVIEKGTYSEENTIELENLEPGTYEIQAYIMHKVTKYRFTEIIDKLYLLDK